MSDVYNNWRTARIIAEAATFRSLHQIYKSDPQLEPKTVATLRSILAGHRDDAEALHTIQEQKSR
jgi:hypothetical protein